MIPLVMKLKVRREGRTVVSLWLPIILALFPVLLLLLALLPLVLLAALFAAMGGHGGTVLRSYGLVFTVLFLLSGLRIEVSGPEDELAVIFR
jgi:hypothetical protein